MPISNDARTTTTATATSLSTPSSATIAHPPLGAPPAVAIPAVPEGFEPIPPVDLRGYYPLQPEVAAAADAVIELHALTNYAAVFGTAAPDRGVLAERLAIAAQWSTLLASSTAWLTYVKSQTGLAWRDALAHVDALKEPFRLATRRVPSFASEYPSLARLLRAHRVGGQRAAATLRKRRRPPESPKVEVAVPTPAARATNAEASQKEPS